ncbi:MAG: 3-oxoacyl-ACP synthase III [Candidatus Hydrogenedentes bacterium]|nr:3-oxoacyl-ACP synthase III [Candidatus Hydrogenedentota bacterium]
MAALGYELAPVVVTSEELEERLAPVYETLHLPSGQLESLTGIAERRWWEKDYSLAHGAARAGRQALEAGGVFPKDVGALIYAGVNRENFEPATACHVADTLGIGGDAAIYDISNACLGMFNGVIDIANRIELGQIRAGLVVSCETAREINDIMIERMLEEMSIELFSTSLATLTGGSGAAAVLLTDASLAPSQSHILLGAAVCSTPEYHGLCRWGLSPEAGNNVRQIMVTDAGPVLKHGVTLGAQTWKRFLQMTGWSGSDVDKVICHQVGATNRDAILQAIGVPVEKDFSTFAYLGNTGTVSVPMTAALADERGFLQRGDRVAWLGIGSGLNCIMLGMEW